MSTNYRPFDKVMSSKWTKSKLRNSKVANNNIYVKVTTLML